MKITRIFWPRLVAAISITFASSFAHACDVEFKVAGDATTYSYEKLPQFVVERVRELVSATTDEMDRYNVVISTTCNSAAPEVATFSIQKNTIYLKELNGVPLCPEEKTDRGLRCIKGRYNYVDYKGGSKALVASKAAVAQAIQTLSSVKTTDDLEAANTNVAAKQKMHDAVRLFALLLAESARFDYVLDDIKCSAASGASIKFMDYWTLVHNWGTITAFVRNSRPDLRPPFAKSGVGSLFVPVTRQMVPVFNQYLVKNPPQPGNVTPDGKNKPVPLREAACALEKASPAPAYDAQVERDHIFSLAAMAMVQKDWQVDDKGRGHNIGSLLIDKTGKPVFWARNAIRQRDNSTQHGEVRLIENFLNCPNVARYMSGYTVYTTLEPCAMCAGMLAMTQVQRVVYVQKDEGFGRALAALRAINYPRVYVESTPLALKEKIGLEDAFTKRKAETGSSSVTDFLLSPEALKIFVEAGSALANFQPKYSENNALLATTQAYMNTVTKEKFGDEMLGICPAPN